MIFGLFSVNNLFYVRYFFLFLFLLICCLSGAGVPVACDIIFTSSHFYLLMELLALLAVLLVYSLCLAFYNLAHLWGSKKKLKAFDVVAKIL